MSKIVFAGIAAIFLAAGTAAKAIAEGITEDAPPVAGGDETAAAARGRGRPKKTEVIDPPEKAAGPNDEERFQANRELIAPLIKPPGTSGEEVKKVISKYSGTGLRDLPAASQADFERDIAALSY